jgi:hypothetical protein
MLHVYFSGDALGLVMMNLMFKEKIIVQRFFSKERKGKKR